MSFGGDTSFEGDGGPLEQVDAGKDNVTFAYSANANHVLKGDIRNLAEAPTAPADFYNQDGTHLDPEALETILVSGQRGVGG